MLTMVKKKSVGEIIGKVILKKVCLLVALSKDAASYKCFGILWRADKIISVLYPSVFHTEIITSEIKATLGLPSQSIGPTPTRDKR